VIVGELKTHTTTMELPGGRAIDVEYVVPEGVPAERVEQAFHRTPEMIAHFSRTFGVDFPWHRYAQVVVHEFIFGGMENAGATVLTDRVIMPPVSKRIGHDLDDLVAHELAHQWFGDLVTCQDWSQAWLNEGWATYSEAIWLEHEEDRAAASHNLWSKLVGYLGEDGGRYQRAITHYRFRNPIDLFDRHLYEKGSLVLHTLRGIVGDAAFWPAVQAYLQRHAFQPVHTRDFQRIMEEFSGRNLDGFFQQFVHGAGHPVVQVELSHADGLLTVAVTQKQSGPDVAEAFHFPLRLHIVTGDGDDAVVTDVTLPIRERTRAFTLPADEAPSRVEIDPWMTVLADLTVKAPRAWLAQSLRSDRGPVGRIRAARALAKDGSPEAITALADAIALDHSWGVHGEIAAALAKQAGPVARTALLGRAADPRHKHRLGVVRALAGVRHADVAAALDALVEDGDPSYLVTAEALRGLGRQRAPQTAARCREVLEDEATAAAIGMETWGASLRAAALDALGHTRDLDALPLLLEHTQAAYEPALRAAAARALGQLGEEIDPARRAAADRLMELAREAPFRVRLSALTALGRAGDPRAAAVLRHVHQGDPDGRTARTAYEALGRLQAADRSGVAAVTRMRDDLTRLQEENRSLRARIDRLEELVERELSGDAEA
jgi:aminopeptidase N